MKFGRRWTAILFRRSRMERDMADELLFHIETRSDDLQRQGFSPSEAARRARLEFGTVEACKETCREEQGVRWLDEFSANFRYTLRMLRKSPGFALASVLSLAVGIGVNITCFSSVNSIVLHPFPFPHLDRIMTVWQPTAKSRSQRARVAAADFFDFKAHNRSFANLAAYRPWDVMLTGVDDPERVQAAQVTPEFFATLGMQPMHGRSFATRECDPGFDAVALVSHAFWKNRMASQPVGTEISLAGRTYKVIGVMPEDFDFPLATELWAPLALTPEAQQQRRNGDLMVIGRLKPGVSQAQALTEFSSLAHTLEQRYPQTNEARSVLILPLGQVTNEITDRFVVIGLVAATFVLLLACANVGNLQLARSTARQKEIGIRAALGASRYRIARQLITESVVIAVLGGILGLFLAHWTLTLQRATIPVQVLQWVAGMRSMRIDPTVMAYSFLLSIFAGVVCCLPSIYQLTREREGVNAALKEGGRSSAAGSARNRARSVLVVMEIALALVLLVGAGVMVRTFTRMMALNTGYDPKNLLTMDMALSATKYRDSAQIARFYQQTLGRLDTLSGVEAAGASGGIGTALKFLIEGRGDPRPGEPRPYIRSISPRYFQAMRIPILQGRSIGDQDGRDTPRTVVISESVARHYWPASSPIGEKIRFGGSEVQWFTVAGVCGDVKDWFGGDPQPAAYLSYQQEPALAMSLFLRTERDPMQSANAARAEIRMVDANQPLYNVKSMEQVMSEESSGVRMSANMMSAYAAISLLLAVMGTYAVGAFFVVQRTQEIGVRVALGATRRDIVRMVLRQTATVSSLGLTVGLALALLMTQIMSHVLYNIVAIEPLTFIALTALLAASALIAAYIPARRAARVDPMIALRNE